MEQQNRFAQRYSPIGTAWRPDILKPFAVTKQRLGLPPGLGYDSVAELLDHLETGSATQSLLTPS